MTSSRRCCGLTSWLAIVAIAPNSGAADGQFVAAPDIPLPRLETIVPGGIDLHFVPGGKLLMSGSFARVNDQEHAGLVRLDAGGSVDRSYDPENIPGRPYFGWRSFAAQVDGTVYLLADQPAGARDRLWRLRPDGSRDPGFELIAGWTTPPPEISAPFIGSIMAGPDGRMLVWGMFDQLGGAAKSDVALLNADGTIHGAFVWRLPMTLQHALPTDGGRWIVSGALDTGVPVPGGGDSTTSVDQMRVLVARILDNGSIDSTFQTYVFAGSSYYGPHAFALDDRGRLVFAEPGPLNALPGLKLVRLLPNGTRDPSFAPVLPAIEDPASPYAFGPGSSAPSQEIESELLLYIAPTVNRIVAAGNGAVMCFAEWEDPALRGVLGVADNGDFDASLVPYTGPGNVRWLRRDPAGTWWGDFAILSTAEPIAGPARLRHDGTIDPAFGAKATSPGYAGQAAALPGGAVVVDGTFDLAGGVASPGLVILEGDGAIRHRRAPGALPWNHAALAAVLSDGSVLVQPAQLFYILAGVRSMEVAATAAAPRFGRLFADGSWQSLVPADAEYFRAVNGWLDADGRVVVHAPGRGTADTNAFASDLLRFLPDGSHDAAFRARDQSGNLVTLGAATASDDGRGAWGITWTTPRQQLLRFGESGQATLTVPLWLNAASPYGQGVYAVAGAPTGVVLGGHFNELNETFSPGLARAGNNGAIDATWGGWLLPDTTIYSARTLGNGLIVVLGALETPLGERRALLLTPDGLPLPVQPRFAADDYISSPWLVSPAGDWITRLVTSEHGATGRVARWQLAAGPEIHVVPSETSIQVGDELTLDVDWLGVPALGAIWYRDGVALNPPPDLPFTFVVGDEDDGAVFWAFVQLEGGGGHFTRPWRLVVSGPWARVTNASIRAIAGVGDQRLILGSVFSGSGGGRILTRALGPALGDLGLGGHAGPLGSALLRLGGLIVAPPEDYRISRDVHLVSHPDVTAAARVVGAYLPALNRPSGNDQMLYENLGAGAYHFQVTPQLATGGGIVLAELFTLNNGGSARRGLAVRNFSGRAVLQPGGGVLIGGFVVEGTRALRVLLRGVGPGLSGHGVTSAAANPLLELYAGTTVLGGNDDWSATSTNQAAVEAAQASTGAFALTRNSRDAATVVTLDPGAYTVIVRSNETADAGRVALLEIYALE